MTSFWQIQANRRNALKSRSAYRPRIAAPTKITS